MKKFLLHYWGQTSTFFKGTALLSISQIFFFISSYGVHIYLGRKLGPSDYGIYSLVISIITLVNLVISTGIPKAAAKFISENKKNAEAIISTTLKMQIWTSIIVFLIYIIISPLIALALKDFGLTKYFLLSALIIPSHSIFSLYDNYFNGIRNYNHQSLIQIMYCLGKLLFIILAVYLVNSTSSAIIGFAISPLVAIIFGILFFPIKLELSSINLFPYKKILNFAMPIIIFSVITHLLYSLDLIFIKYLINDNKLIGYYSAAANVAKTISYLPAPISFVIFPAISHSSFTMKNLRTRNYIKKSFYYLLFAIVGFLVIFLLFSKNIITILFTEQYIEAVGIFKVLSLAMAFYSFFILCQIIIAGIGKPSTNIYIATFSLVICILANIIFIMQYGIIGAAYATLLTSFTGCILSLAYVYKKIFYRNV